MSLRVGSVLLQSSLGPFQFGRVTDSLSQPLKEQEYKHTGKCSLFVHSSHMHPRLAWMPLVSIVELLVCQLSVSSPCKNQNWNWKGKNCYHLEKNHNAGMNCNAGQPTKFIQCLSVTFLVFLGGLKVHSSRGLVGQSCTVAVHDWALNC